MNNRKEVKRENKQVRKLKKLRSLDSKGKTDTNRYKKLKKQVYNPFIDDRKDMKKMGAAMGKVKNPIPKYDPDPTPDKAFKKMVFKQGINDFNKRSAAAQKKEASKLISKKQPMNPKILPYKYPESGAIEMTGHPGEYLMGGGAIGGFKTAKTVIGKVAQAGQGYAVQSAKKSIKPRNIVTNSL